MAGKETDDPRIAAFGWTVLLFTCLLVGGYAHAQAVKNFRKAQLDPEVIDDAEHIVERIMW